MISNDITGNSAGDASQVFNLLAVVANPEAYGAKLKALVTATEENKKYVELVAPASEIIELKKQAALDKAAAAKLLEDAKVEAAKIKADAQVQVKAMTTETNELVAKAKQIALEAQNASAAKMAEMDAVLSNLKGQLLAASNAEKAAKAQTVAVLDEKKLLEAEKTQVVSLKSKLLAKAKSFAEDIVK